MLKNKKLNKIMGEWKWTLLGLLGIIIIGFILRIVNLTVLPIFGDEAIYIRWSQIMGAEPGLRFVPLSDGKQPLFMWVLMFIVRRFSDPLFISRLTSVFYGMGTLVGIFVLCILLFKSKKIALISSLFWAISPYALFYDRLALVDSMLTMFGIWTLVLAVTTSKTLRLDFAMLTGFVLGGALLTKSPGIYFVVMLPVVWIISNWPERREFQFVGKKDLVHLIKLVDLTLVSYIIAFGMYNILRLGENFQMIAIRNKDYIYPIVHIFTSFYDPLKPHMNDIVDWLLKLGPGVILVFFVTTIFIHIKKIGSTDIDEIKRPDPAIALLFIWTLFPMFMSAEYAKVFTSRYILFSLPTFIIFSSYAIVYIYKNKLIKKIMCFGLAVFILEALFVDSLLLTNPDRANMPRVVRSGYLEEWTAGTGIKEISQYLKEEYARNPNQKIVVGTEGYFGTLPDGLQIYLNDTPQITVIGVGIDLKEIPNSLVESEEAGNKTYLVINASRLKADPEKLGLRTVALYSKAFRPVGSSQYNLLGPRDTLYLFELDER